MTAVLPAPANARPECIDELRRVLAGAGYDADSIKALLHSDGDLLMRARDLPVHVRRIESDRSALATLTALFVLGVTVDADQVDAALAPLGSAGLEQLGLASRDGARLRGEVRLVPHDELVIASDRPDDRTAETHVAAVHRPSVSLAELTVRRPVRRALDVGTGNGIQSILISRHADEVVATDVNERALVFARFNARLNGVHNVEFRHGSFFEPVADDQFDLIAPNPPYVISPESEFLFRDSGLGGDRVSSEVTRALPAHLAEGGFATVMVSWIHNGGEPTAAPRTWLEGSGCDAWIFYTGTDDPLLTAAKWNADARTNEELEERVGRWIDYYRENAIEGIAYGCIVLRRRTGTNWIRSTELKHGVSTAGGHIERIFRAADLLEADDDVLALRFRFVDGATIEEELEPRENGWLPRAATLKLGSGLGFTAGLDAMAARVVAAIEPGRSVQECLDAVAAEVDAPSAELRRAGGELVRRLLELGFVEPA
jgi:methylase of polypeptide subunit release factors